MKKRVEMNSIFLKKVSESKREESQLDRSNSTQPNSSSRHQRPIHVTPLPHPPAQRASSLRPRPALPIKRQHRIRRRRHDMQYGTCCALHVESLGSFELFLALLLARPRQAQTGNGRMGVTLCDGLLEPMDIWDGIVLS